MLGKRPFFPFSVNSLLSSAYSIAKARSCNASAIGLSLYLSRAPLMTEVHCSKLVKMLKSLNVYVRIAHENKNTKNIMQIPHIKLKIVR